MITERDSVKPQLLREFRELDSLLELAEGQGLLEFHRQTGSQQNTSPERARSKNEACSSKYRV